jgi:hypothetical protein
LWFSFGNGEGQLIGSTAIGMSLYVYGLVFAGKN